MFVVWQAAYFLIFNPAGSTQRTVDVVASIGFIAWGAALLMLVATGGGIFRGRAVREILDDEWTRATRGVAYQRGFWALMLISLVAYGAAAFVPVSPRTLAHISLSAGVIVTVATVVRSNWHDR